MVSEVLKYVAEERSYSVTVFGLRFDIFTDRDKYGQILITLGRTQYGGIVIQLKG